MQKIFLVIVLVIFQMMVQIQESRLLDWFSGHIGDHFVFVIITVDMHTIHQYEP